MQVSLTNDVSLPPPYYSLNRGGTKPQGPVTILLSSRDKPSKSGTSTPTQADEVRQKQKEMAEAKARKKEEFEAKAREKERAKKEKEEEWRVRNQDKGAKGKDEGGGVEALKIED